MIMSIFFILLMMLLLMRSRRKILFNYIEKMKGKVVADNRTDSKPMAM